jgi:hypothetical protein
MIADVAKLGFIEGDVLDMTYGDGNFWSVWHPENLVANDLYKEFPKCLCPVSSLHWYDFRCTEWPSGSFDTVVFDPPYKMSGTPASEEMDGAYGTEVVRTRSEILSMLVGGIAEGSRLTSKWLLVKCQDQVSSGKVRWMTTAAIDAARALEMRHVDSFIFQSGRPQPKGRKQKHSRHEYSHLMVFGKR